MNEDFDKAYLRELAYKWKNGNLTDDEQQYLDDWENSHLDDLLLLSDESGGPEVVKQRMLDHLLSGMAEVSVNRRSYRLWPRFRIKSGMTGLVAAAAVAAIVLGVYFFNYKVSPDVKSGDEMVKNDVAPGKNGATITLADGTVVQLSDAKTGVVIGGALKYSDGSDVRYSSGSSRIESGTGSSSGSLKGSQSSTGPVGVHSLTPIELLGADGKAQILTASTARGQTYQFTLPDGTKVWLNADSKLEFSSSFVNSKTRNVKLSGEGYFEVSKDRVHPFIVETDLQNIEVLGTHFNVNSYSDESVATTTLLEGAVKMTINKEQGSKSKDVMDTKILKPGQQAINGGNDIKVSDANIENTMDWKEGDFYLDRIDFKAAMRKIERWYDVEVIYDSTVPDNIETGGWISRNKKLSNVLKFIEASGMAHFKIEGKKVYVSK